MIIKQNPDVIVLRFGSRFRYVQKLKKDFPQLKICIEYNASIFDEWLGCIPGRSLWRREEIRQLGFADSISVVSKYLCRSLLSKSPLLKDKIFVNPNGADTEMFKPLGKIVRTESRLEMGIPDDAVVLGYVGGMESIRRIPEIVSRVAELRRSGLDKIFLVLIGAGQDLEAVLQAIDNYPDLENWVYCSRCWEPHQRIPSLMAAFDMVIFSDFYPYSSPLKIFEYMSYALPIVGPDISAVTDFLDDENMPFLFHRDGSNFDEVVRHVYNNLGLCRAKALRNRDLVKQKYTWAANVSRFVDAINVASSARYKL
jgi:glycosyltransferase involved in cell wall biosynthesis